MKESAGPYFEEPPREQVEERPKIGDVVTARLVNESAERQGVFVKDYGDGTVEVLGLRGSYRCLAQDAVIVPEANLFGEMKRLAEEIRRRSIA